MACPKPAILTGAQPVQNLEEFYSDSGSGFVGLDLYHLAKDLDLGYATQLRNLYNTGADLAIRPGKAAQLPSANADPNQSLYAALDNTGATWILYVSGGPLYCLKNGTTTQIEIELNTGTPGSPVPSHLDLGDVRFARIGQQIFFFDPTASSGTLYYTTLVSGQTSYAYEVTALTQPTIAPIAALTSASFLTGFWPSLTGAENDIPPQYAQGVGQAVATATVVAGVITVVTLDHGGYYGEGAAAPTVSFQDNGGTPTGVAAVTATINAAGQVTGFTGLSGGTGYSSSANIVVVFTVATDASANAFPESWTEESGSHGWCSAGNTLGWTAAHASLYGRGTGTVATMASVGAPSIYDTDAQDGTTPLQWLQFNSDISALSTATSSAKAIQNVIHADGSSDWATLFAFACSYYQGNIHAGITVEVQPFSDYEATQSLAAPQSVVFNPKAKTGAVSSFPALAWVFDFSELSAESGNQTPIKSWAVTITGNPNVVPPGPILSSGLYIGYITGGPIWGNLVADPIGTFTAGSWAAAKGTPNSQAAFSQQGTVGGWNGNSAADNSVNSPTITSLTKDARLTTSYGSGAVATAHLTGTAVSSVSIGTDGSGYLLGTVVSFVGGGGTGAAGTVTLALDPSGVTYKITGVAITHGGTGYTGAPAVVFGQSFANIEFVDVPLSGFIQGTEIQFAVPNFAIVLRLLPAGAGQSYQQLLLTIDPSGLFASTDVTSLLPADLACIASAQILFIDNPIASPSEFVFNIGSLTFAGNLTVNTGTAAVPISSYQWCYTEIDENGDTTFVAIIESDPSPFSNVVSPTGELATAQLTLPDAPMNAASTGAFLYRAGGTAPNDGLFTLVATFTWGETFSMGQQPISDSLAALGVQLAPNPYVSWGDPNGPTPPTGSKYFVDNTPDGNLLNNPTLILGKQPLPSGTQYTAIAVYQGRLAISTLTGIYISWLLGSYSQAGVYFNPTVSLDDPNISIKGEYFPVGFEDNDPIVGMAPLGTILTIWKRLGVYYLSGFDPSTFTCQPYTSYQYEGQLAPLAIAVGDNVVYVLLQDGVYTFDGNQIQKISDALDPLLNPVLNEDGVVTPAAAYASCAMVYHGGRLYLLAPTPGGSSNSVCYLWDTRFTAWTGQWIGMAMTSGCSIGSDVDTADIFFGGLDGMIYKMSGHGDTATHGGSVSAVSFSFASRGYAQPPEGLTIWLQGKYNMELGIEDKAWVAAFMRARPTRLWLQTSHYNGSTPEPISLGITTTYQDNGIQRSYTVQSQGDQRLRIKCKPDRGGLAIVIGITGSTLYNFQLIGLGLTVARGARVN